MWLRVRAGRFLFTLTFLDFLLLFPVQVVAQHAENGNSVHGSTVIVRVAVPARAARHGAQFEQVVAMVCDGGTLVHELLRHAQRNIVERI